MHAQIDSFQTCPDLICLGSDDLQTFQFPNKTLRFATIFVAEACPSAAPQRRGHGQVTKTLELSTPRGLPGASRMVVNTLCFAQKGHSDL